jgi:hypothetical protein
MEFQIRALSCNRNQEEVEKALLLLQNEESPEGKVGILDAFTGYFSKENKSEDYHRAYFQAKGLVHA